MLSEYNRISSHNTEIVHINPESIERAQDFVVKSKLTREAIPFAVVADTDRATVKAYVIQKPTEKQVEVFPSVFLIDRNGTLRFKYIGSDPFDRPPVEHLEEILGVIEGGK